MCLSAQQVRKPLCKVSVGTKSPCHADQDELHIHPARPGNSNKTFLPSAVFIPAPSPSPHLSKPRVPLPPSPRTRGAASEPSVPSRRGARAPATAAAQKLLQGSCQSRRNAPAATTAPQPPVLCFQLEQPCLKLCLQSEIKQ